MKNFLLTLLVLSFIGVASASEPLLTCKSDKDNFTLCVYDLSSENWSSILITWSHAETCDAHGGEVTYSRQFVQNEVYSISAEGMEAYQNNRFLGFGRRTKFSLDRLAGTATLSGKNGDDFITLGGIGAPSERKGKYLMEFSNCR